MNKPSILLSLSLLLIAGCGSDASTPDNGVQNRSDEDNKVAGPCVHGYAEPVLTIRTATSQPSDEAIGRVVLRSLALNGRTVDVSTWGASSTWSHVFFNITVENDALYCDVPCGFGGDDGRYDFVAVAADHYPLHVSIEARYASIHGGCPSFSDDGTDVALRLTRR